MLKFFQFVSYMYQSATDKINIYHDISRVVQIDLYPVIYTQMIQIRGLYVRAYGKRYLHYYQSYYRLMDRSL